MCKPKTFFSFTREFSNCGYQWLQKGTWFGEFAVPTFVKKNSTFFGENDGYVVHRQLSPSNSFRFTYIVSPHSQNKPRKIKKMA